MIDLSTDIGVNFDMDSSVSKEDFIDNIVSLVKDILTQHFHNNPIKQQVRVHRDRINFACPFCNDSMHNQHRKRGNIILEGKHVNHYKCHNCGYYSTTNDFFKRFNKDLDLGVINYMRDTGVEIAHRSNKYDSSLLLDINSIESFAIEREVFKETFKLIEAKGSYRWGWLVNRLQGFNANKILYDQKNDVVFILNLTPSGKILGSQKRTFFGDNTYLTFNLSKICELMNKGSVPDEMNIISQLFGITTLDFGKNVTVFEGPFDSFLFKNSVANTGANKNFPLDINVRYFYDSDRTGNKKSLERIDAGDQVFLWSRFIKDVGLPYRKKWDLNDVMIYAHKENITLPSFEGYFSKDQFDAIDL